MKPKKELLNQEMINRTITRLTHQILEKNRDLANLAIIGMQSRGIYVAQEIQKKISEIEGLDTPMGVLDTALYRDDYRFSDNHPDLRVTDIPFDITGKHIVLIDDVLYTGRTVRAALDALVDIGRPKTVQLCTLVDRGRRELPISADYTGMKMTTSKTEHVEFTVGENNEFSLWLLKQDD